MNISREPNTLDPRRGGDLIGSTLHFMLFEGLMRLTPDGSVVPAQAESVEISDDRKTYIFHLRNTFWSNGTPVTAHDFEYAWKKILTPTFPAPNAHLFYSIKNSEAAKRGQTDLESVGVKAVDETTLVVELEHPTPYFLDLISFCVFHPVSKQIDESNPSWMNEAGTHFVCNGPFQLSSWHHNDELVLKKNRLYWESNKISLDQITISMVGDENTALQMYENGELDFIGLGISPLPSQSLIEHRQQIKQQAVAKTSFITFNISRYPFTNKNIRKAFAYGINRHEILAHISQLDEKIAYNITPPPLPNPSEPLFVDQTQKEALHYFTLGMKELGLTRDTFPTLTFHYSNSDLHHRLAQALQQQWSQLFNIEITLQRNDHQMLLDRLVHRQYDFAQTFWFAQYHDPLSIYERFKYKDNPKNYPGWENREFIRLLDTSSLESDPAKRMQLLFAAEQLFHDEMPLVPLYHWKDAFMIKDHISYEPYAPTGSFDLTRLSVHTSH